MEPGFQLAALGASTLPPWARVFRWLTYGLGAVAAAAVGIPFIGYLFGPGRPRSIGCPWGLSRTSRRARRAW